MVDEAWDAFAKALSREMHAPPRLTSAALALRLGVDEETVSNWRRGRGRPPLPLLRRIVTEVVRDRGDVDDPQFTIRSLLREMGVLEPDVDDRDLLDRAIRLQKLQLKLDDANAAAAQLGRQMGAARIAQAAIESGEWAVGIWPAYEGPAGYEKIHVADRVDITRTGGSGGADTTLTDDDVWHDPAMKAALRATRALRTTASPRFGDHVTLPVSRWSVMHVGSPRDPVTPSPWPGLGSLCFVATTVDSWVNDVAALAALAIGYGLTSTRDLALEIFSLTSGRDRNEAMWSIHAGLLRDPPRRRVWSHFGVPTVNNGDFVRHDQFVAGQSTIYVVVDEDDAMLAGQAARSAWTLDEWHAARDHLQRSAGQLPADQVIRLSASAQPDRDSRWAQALTHCLGVLQGLDDLGVRIDPGELRHLEQITRRIQPSVANPVFGWLSAHGWPRE